MRKKRDSMPSMEVFLIRSKHGAKTMNDPLLPLQLTTAAECGCYFYGYSIDDSIVA